jgi:hypothetical protein
MNHFPLFLSAMDLQNETIKFIHKSNERDHNLWNNLLTSLCNFTCRLKDLCSKACDIGQKLKSGDISQDSAMGIEKHFLGELKGICKQPLRFKPAETLRAYLIGPEQKNLFTFLRIPGVPPTNNHAEQSLRKMVIFRKVCFGTRSEKGLKSHSIIPSLVQTAKRQGVHPLTFLKTLLTANAAKAQAVLYNNSS